MICKVIIFQNLLKKEEAFDLLCFQRVENSSWNTDTENGQRVVRHCWPPLQQIGGG